MDRFIENWQAAGLIKPSVFKPILTTIENGMVIKKLGSLHDNDLHTLRQLIRHILG